MDIREYLRAIELVDVLKDELLALPRILRGSLSVRARRDLIAMLDRFRKNTENLGVDHIVRHTFQTIYGLAQDITNDGANDNGGYIQTQKHFEALLNLLGFVKGYLFVKYDDCRGKPQPKPKRKGDPDEDNEDDDLLALEFGKVKV
eukprot:TRINITY_DN12458_c0_g1_i1.p1 TRINITY_DN12458_c0_g1~~TRINITY_DN12458_c0_g1_i1.p1  ORF type:complete len:146 (-),score=23.13 TRINITY_DN12458_c0_g1_i1:93-530(-)